MEHFVFHWTFGSFGTALLWGGLAIAARIFALLLISESSSGVRPPAAPASRFIP
jgi:hypothetical protein